MVIVVVFLVLFAISSNMDAVESASDDCNDACSTACVNRDRKFYSLHSYSLFLLCSVAVLPFEALFGSYFG